jgi:hypothetical protein
MPHQHTTDTPNGQRSAVPTAPHDELLALCRYKSLRLMNMHGRVTLQWVGEDGTRCMGPLSWKTVYERGDRPLLFMLDDGFPQWCPPFDWLSCEKLGSFLHTLDLLEPVADDWRAVLKKYGIGWYRSYVTMPIPQGKRSQIIFKIGVKVAEKGATEKEVGMVLEASKSWQSKFGTGNTRALKNEIARVMRKSHGRH